MTPKKALGSRFRFGVFVAPRTHFPAALRISA
jgi:hypothetical protein